ncbi:hypothetical protein F5I97DRAFT_1029860 [Phlebopus sp. FC_14]|nr:hypothetical protein F5I97DRAFT_1029860 [Phlebopus sp. FC_14]
MGMDRSSVEVLRPLWPCRPNYRFLYTFSALDLNAFLHTPFAVLCCTISLNTIHHSLLIRHAFIRTNMRNGRCVVARQALCTMIFFCGHGHRSSAVPVPVNQPELCSGIPSAGLRLQSLTWCQFRPAADFEGSLANLRYTAEYRWLMRRTRVWIC